MAHLFVMPRSPLSSGDSSQTYKPELPDDAPDRIAVNMTVGDRRILEQKAKGVRKSPTQWIISAINGELGGDSTASQGDKKASPFQILFGLDRRRRVLADETAKKLGFLNTEDLAKDLLHRAIEDPEMADEFLFGRLRARLQSETPPQKKAA